MQIQKLRVFFLLKNNINSTKQTIYDEFMKEKDLFTMDSFFKPAGAARARMSLMSSNKKQEP
jgi:hypothetical protein